MRCLVVLAALMSTVIADEQELINRLGATFPGTRAAAAKELGRLKSRPAVPALIDSLHDDSFSVRQAAVKALGSIGDPAAVPALAKLVDGGHKKEAVAALVAIGAASVSAFIERVKDPKTREATFDLLCETPLLIHFAMHESWRVRRWALRRVARLERLSGEWVGVLGALLIRDDSGAVRASAATVLGRHRYTRFLVTGLRDREAGVRMAAAAALGRAEILAKDEVEALITASRKDPSERVRLSATLALSRAGEHKDLAITALKSLPGTPAAVTLGRLGHWDERVIATTIAALKEFGYNDRRIRNLRAAGGVDLNRTAARLFEKAPKATMVPRLLKEMNGAKPKECVYLVRALGHFSAVPLSALKDKDVGVRHAAALSQPRIEALPVLLTIHPRHIIEDAIKKIGTAALPEMLRHWERELRRVNKDDLDGNIAALPDEDLQEMILGLGKKAVRKALRDTLLHAYVREHFSRRVR